MSERRFASRGWCVRCVMLLLLLITIVEAGTFRGESANLWALADAGSAGTAAWQPSGSLRVRLNESSLSALLSTAPAEDAEPVRNSSAVITLPRPDGAYERFAFVESSVMQQELQSAFPQIRSYLGQGLDDPSATVRFDVSLLGFRAQVLRATQPETRGRDAWYIASAAGETGSSEYLSYWRSAASAIADGRCDTPEPHALIEPETIAAFQGGFEVVRNEFVIAVAATGEFSASIAAQMNPPQTPSVDLTMSVINSTVNRLNQILERDGPVRLILVNGNERIVYLDPNTDPYVGMQTDSDGDGQPDWLQMMAENQSNLDSVIGTDNYSLGHVFHWQANNYSGRAAVAGVCDEDNKASAISATSTAIDPATNLANDLFVIDLVAHEVGHQLGARHTFNGSAGGCGSPGQYAAGSAYEPGSGSTIMSYGGICGTDDIVSPDPANAAAGVKEPMYSFASMLQMAPVVVGAALDCGTRVHTGNTHPGATPASQGPYYIPTNTAFRLNAANVAFSEPGEAVTVSMEQADLGSQRFLGIDTGAHEPLFRVFPPTTSGERWFPQYDSVIDGTASLGETLPLFARSSVFKTVLRDNVAGGGGWGMADTLVEFVQAPFPGFSLIAPLGGGGVQYCGGEPLGVLWEVAGSNEAPISAEFVDILMSTDNGQNFPWTLAADFPNAGAALVPLPFVPTTEARVKVQSAGGLFYDVNRFPFEVASGPPTIVSQPVGVEVCPGESFTLSVIDGGGSPRHIQWYRNGEPIAGETNTSYDVGFAQTFHTGDYHVVVSNGCADVPSETVRVQVGVSFDQLPISRTPQACDEAAFDVVARGVGSLSHRWLHGGEFLADDKHIVGAETPSLRIEGTRYEDEGIYWCAVTDECHTRTTDVVELTLPTPPWAHVATSGPLRRHQQRTDMAFDAARGVSVLYGGYGVTPTGVADDLDDTWEWDGVEWMQRFPAHNPGRREQHELVFDTERDKILLFGGWSPAPVLSTSEVWEYDGADWTLVTTSPGGPPADYAKQGDAAFDSARGKMIVLCDDGFHPDPPTNKTWEFDSATATWENVYTGVGPSQVVSPITYDAEREVGIGQYHRLGTNEAYTWSYWNGEWDALPGAGPLRYYPAMAYDTVRRRATMFGSGRDIGTPSEWHSDTYALVGADWVQILPEFHEALPGGAFPPTAMSFDSRRRAMVMIANDYEEQFEVVPVQTWEYRYLDRPVFDREPTGAEVVVGRTARLTAHTAGAAALSHQWRMDDEVLVDGPRPDGATISGSNTAELTIENVRRADAGNYTLEVSNACGTLVSELVVINVTLLGDCVADGAVDLLDFQEMIDCLGAPGEAVLAGCECFDLRVDGAADLRDFAELQVGFGQK